MMPKSTMPSLAWSWPLSPIRSRAGCMTTRINTCCTSLGYSAPLRLPEAALGPQLTEGSDMSGLLGRRAVVVGAGIGGLSMAGALAKHFEVVEVFERDRLTASPASRSGTPQDRHPHGLLAGGLRALGEIFPGFEDDLARAGAVPVRVAQDMQYERADVGVLPKRDFGLSLLCASRPLIELVLRRRAQAIPNLTLRPGCRVTGIVPAPGSAAARAVRC